MSIRLDRAMNEIGGCTTFAELTPYLEHYISKNLIEHVGSAILQKVQTLDLSTVNDEFLRLMIWASIYGSSDTIYNIFKEVTHSSIFYTFR